MVGEDEVAAAAVYLKAGPQDLLGHRRALDVPARPTWAPGRVPGGVLCLLMALPEREVLRIALQSGSLAPVPLIQIRRMLMGQLAVLGV